MRTHPLGIMCLSFPREDIYKTAIDYSRISHVDPRCVLSCCICTVLISQMLKGEVTRESNIDEVLEDAFRWVKREYRPDSDVNESSLDQMEFRRHVYVKTLTELQLDDSQKMGYVYKCLGSAILCLRLAMRSSKTSMNTFELVITDLILEGGDADTNACCAGALLGAWFGFSKLPHHWREGLMHRDWLVEKVECLCKVAGITDGSYRGIDDPDTQTDDERGDLPQETLHARKEMMMTRILMKDKEKKEKEMTESNLSRKRGKPSYVARLFGNKYQN